MKMHVNKKIFMSRAVIPITGQQKSFVNCSHLPTVFEGGLQGPKGMFVELEININTV